MVLLLLRFVIIFLGITYFICTRRNCQCSICRLNLASKFHSILISVPADLETAYGIKFIFIFVMCLHTVTCVRAHSCLCVCVCVCDISLSASDLKHLKKEISNCMGTIRRLRHWFVLWHHTSHIPSAPLIFEFNNICVFLISQTIRYYKKNK
jgi:hypothetical protein